MPPESGVIERSKRVNFGCSYVLTLGRLKIILTLVKALLSNPFFYELSQTLLGVNSSRQWQVNNFIRLAGDERILDVGCGPAELLRFLPEGVDYTGIDMSPSYIESARRKFGSRGKFFCADSSSIKGLVEGKFDVVLATGLLHHLPNSGVASLAKDARDLLKPDGRFLTVDPVWTTPQNFIAKRLLKADRGDFIRTKEEYVDLLKASFGTVEATIKTDLLVLPYSHALITSRI